MSKIVIELLVPACGLKEDLMVPYEKPLHETLELIKGIFNENPSFVADERSLLCDSTSGSIYNPALTPEELMLKNGSSLMLI